MNLANLAASLLYKPDSTNVDYNILGIQTLVVRLHVIMAISRRLSCQPDSSSHLLVWRLGF